jgi:hypothetical protein
MHRPIINNNTITIPEGYGYWDLSLFSWGGCFRRMKEETTLTIVKIYKRCNDGTPREVECNLNGVKIGIST